MAVLKYKQNGVWHDVGGLSAGEKARVDAMLEEEIANVYKVMAAPVLAPKTSWYKGNTKKEEITQINVVDSYTVNGNETESWAADENGVGTIMCYIDGTVLTISCERARGLALNANSEGAFAQFTNATELTGQEWLRMERISRAYGLFSGSGFTQLGDPSWNFANAWNMATVFASMPNLVSVDLGRSTLANANTTRQMCGASKKLERFTAPALRMNKVVSIANMFLQCESLQAFSFGNSTLENCTDASRAFYECKALQEFSFGNGTLENCTNMSEMFHNCVSLRSIDLSNLKLGNVTNFYMMFSSVGHSTAETAMNLEELKGIETLDVSSCEDFSFMFYGCRKLKTLDLSKWDVSKGKTFSHMFADTTALKTLTFNDGKAWNPVSAVSFNAMFNDCAAERIDISSFSVAKPMCLSQMFERFKGEIVGYATLNTSEGTEFGEMFSGTNLSDVSLLTYNTKKASGTVLSGDVAGFAGFTNMFADAKYLRRIILGADFDTDGDGTLSSTQVFQLPVPSAEYIPGADGYWHDLYGNSFAADAIPNPAAQGLAITLYAVNPLGGG